MSLSIDLYANEGSPLNIVPPDIYGRGVGGAELAMMSWAETMASRGHHVRIYNSPSTPGHYDGVEYLMQSDFQPRDPRDVFVVYRSPNRYTRLASANVKLFWSCDQYTSGDFRAEIFPYVDRTVCISPYHVDYHKKRYEVEDSKIGYFDLGVRLQDYDLEVEKVAGRCIYCSVPDRGLDLLHILWPRIKERVPHASLVITSDYTLWGAANPLNQQHRLRWLYHQGVQFFGKVPRKQLVEEQLKAVCQPYACQYEELFCISAAECQVARAVPVTSSTGALATTNQWGVIVPGEMQTRAWQDEFVDRVCVILSYPEKSGDGAIRELARDAARRRFDWQTICEQWEYLIETGEYATKTNNHHAGSGQRAGISTVDPGREVSLAATN